MLGICLGYIGVMSGLYLGCIGVIFGLYWDSIGRTENNMESIIILGLYRGIIYPLANPL